MLTGTSPVSFWALRPITLNILTLGRHRRWRVLSSVIPSVRPSVWPSVCPSVCSERRSGSNSLRISVISPNLVEWCTVAWNRSLFKMAMLGQFLRVPRNFEIFHERLILTRSEGRCYCSNSLRISCISPKFGGMMHSNMKQMAIYNGNARLIFFVFHETLKFPE